MDAVAQRARDAAAAAEPGAGRQVGDRTSPRSAASRCRPDTRVLIAPLDGVGRDYPLSIEKLCPVLSFYVVTDWREGCERCKQILRYGGMGHTMSIHSQNEQVILEFGLQEAGVPHRRQHADDARVDRADDRPRSGDDARLRRLRRQHHVRQHLAAASAEHQAAGVRGDAGRQPVGSACGRRDSQPRSAALAAGAATGPSRRPASAPRSCRGGSTQFLGLARLQRSPARSAAAPGSDRRRAAATRPSRSISSAKRTSGWRFAPGGSCCVAERAIVTPAARDLAEEHRVFPIAPWRE